jgi:hypothetical protein
MEQHAFSFYPPIKVGLGQCPNLPASCPVCGAEEVERRQAGYAGETTKYACGGSYKDPNLTGANHRIGMCGRVASDTMGDLLRMRGQLVTEIERAKETLANLEFMGSVVMKALARMAHHRPGTEHQEKNETYIIDSVQPASIRSPMIYILMGRHYKNGKLAKSLTNLGGPKISDREESAQS